MAPSAMVFFGMNGTCSGVQIDLVQINFMESLSNPCRRVDLTIINSEIPAFAGMTKKVIKVTSMHPIFCFYKCKKCEKIYQRK